MRSSLLPALVGSLAFCAALAVGQAARAALVHRYSFNDGTANDSAGTAHGTLVRGATVAGGQVVFDAAVNDGINTNPATGQYVDLPDGVARLRNVTIEAWFTWRGGDRWQRVFDFGNNQQKFEITPSDTTTTGYLGKGFFMLSPRNNPGNMVAQISIDSHGGASDTDFSAMSTPLPTHVEHHVAFVHDRDAGVQRLYLNGVQVGQDVATVDPSTPNYLNTWLGRSQFQQDPFFNGTINELRIYDNGLPADAVQFNVAQGPNGLISVPEPSGVGLLATLAGAALARRRRAGR